MGFGYVLGTTPVVESVNLSMKLFNSLEGAPIQITQSKLEPLTLLCFFYWQFF